MSITVPRRVPGLLAGLAICLAGTACGRTSPDVTGALAPLLASDGAGYLNGQTFHVDGGIMTHL